MQIKGLWFTALPDQAIQLRLDRERREIMEQMRQALGRSLGAGQDHHQIAFEEEWAIGAAGLVQALISANPTLIHYSGHGDAGMGLVLQDPRDKVQGLTGQGLAQILSKFKSVRVVVLNACELVEHARHLFEGTRVEAVIATTRPINDRTAIVFAGQFYALLARKMSVGQAFELANQLAVIAVPADEGVLTLLTRDGLDAANITLDKPAMIAGGNTEQNASNEEDSTKLPPLLGILNVGADDAFAEGLRKALRLQVKKGTIRLWEPRDILPGSDLNATIEQMLAEAEVYLPIISADLICDGEVLTDPMERFLNTTGSTKKLVGIYARSADLGVAWLEGRTILPRVGVGEEQVPLNLKGDLDHAFTKIASEIAKVVQTLK